MRRDAGQVVAVEVQQVEGLIDQPARVAAAQRLLQTSETADAVGGEGDDLAVEQRLFDGQLLHVPGEFREAVCPVLGVAGDQPDLAAIEADHDAIAIELDLMNPVRALRDLVDQRRQLRVGLLGHVPAARPVQLRYALRRGDGVCARAVVRAVPGALIGLGALVARLRLPGIVDVLGDLAHGAVAGDAAIVVADLQRLIL